jgi:DNA-3-methyladenine glycosylase II
MAGIMSEVGPCRLADAQREDPFHALVETIVGQQLSMKAAATIFGRFVALFPDGPFPAPEQVAARTDADLRGVGFSRQKIGYLRDLCAKVRAGEVPLADLDTLADEAVIERLTVIKGIGRWSAEMILMFKLHRADVLPVDDLGIVKAMTRAYRLRKPTPARLLKIGEAWRPYRSVASWYLWASLENAPPADGLAAPAKRSRA